MNNFSQNYNGNKEHSKAEPKAKAPYEKTCNLIRLKSYFWKHFYVAPILQKGEKVGEKSHYELEDRKERLTNQSKFSYKKAV